MTTADIAIGGTYTAKVCGKLTTVQVLERRENGLGRSWWVCLNIATRRIVALKSPQRFRSEVK